MAHQQSSTLFDRFQSDLGNNLKSAMYCLGLFGLPQHEKTFTYFQNSLLRMGAEAKFIKTSVAHMGGFVYLKWETRG
jgi:hypothetical protein